MAVLARTVRQVSFLRLLGGDESWRTPVRGLGARVLPAVRADHATRSGSPHPGSTCCGTATPNGPCGQRDRDVRAEPLRPSPPPATHAAFETLVLSGQQARVSRCCCWNCPGDPCCCWTSRPTTGPDLGNRHCRTALSSRRHGYCGHPRPLVRPFLHRYLVFPRNGTVSEVTKPIWTRARSARAIS